MVGRSPTTAAAPQRALLLALLCAPACSERPRTFHAGPTGPGPLFADRFDRRELGPDYRATGPGARIRDGRLHLEGLHNHPVWLVRPLPDDVHVRFDAWALSEAGDIKFELAGDGKSFARSANYVSTGYVFIFGGWDNTRTMIARRNEHGRDVVTRDDRLPEPGRAYHMDVYRKDGTIRWEVDGEEVLTYEDPHPLAGEGHRFFAFGNWEAPTAFDNLEISAL